MRPIKFPLWAPARARERVLTAAQEWQDCERRAAFARIASLAETVRDWDLDADPQSRPVSRPCTESSRPATRTCSDG